MRINGHEIDAIGIEHNEQVIPLPLQLETLGNADKVKSLSQMAGVVNQALKATGGSIPTGGRMNFYNKGKLMGSVMWAPNPKDAVKRKIVTMYDSIFLIETEQPGQVQSSQVGLTGTELTPEPDPPSEFSPVDEEDFTTLPDNWDLMSV